MLFLCVYKKPQFVYYSPAGEATASSKIRIGLYDVKNENEAKNIMAQELVDVDIENDNYNEKLIEVKQMITVKGTNEGSILLF